jgi:tripartite-type tricarboxylate transporter receptor subunit TctC
MATLNRRELLSVTTGAAVLLAAGRTSAQGGPGGVVNLVVPQAAGGAVDLVARAYADYMTKARGTPAIVVNKPGAAGEIAATFVTGAPADGSTLLVGNSSTMVVSPQVKRTRYDPLRDLRALGGIVLADTVLLASKSLGVKTLDDLVRLARAQPGKLAYGSNGVGGAFHLAMEYFQFLTDTQLLHVPFNGAAQAEMALVGGQVQVMVANTGPAMAQVRTGALIPLAVTGSKPSIELPDLPLASATIPRFIANTWVGLYAPRNIPDAKAAELHAMVEDYFRDPQGAAFLRSRGFTPVPATLAEADAWLRGEMRIWGAIVAEARKKGPLE